MAQSLLVSAVCGVCLAVGLAGAQGEKDTRTAAQRKINSQLLAEIYRARGQARQKGVPPGPTDVDIDTHGRALVDVRAPVSAALGRRIRTLGGRVMSTSARDESTIARIPILRLEKLAAAPTVRAIEPAAGAITNRRPDRGD